MNRNCSFIIFLYQGYGGFVFYCELLFSQVTYIFTMLYPGYVG